MGTRVFLLSVVMVMLVAGDALAGCATDSDCDDGIFCNGTEICLLSACVGGKVPDCNDGVACTVDTCDGATDSCRNVPNDSACDDGAFCNGRETCEALGCVPAAPPDCDDGVRCTVDSCNEAADACEHAPDDGACDDRRFCNGTETCDASAGCRRGNAPSCEDGVACTIDSCDETARTCAHTPDNGACDDRIFCNGSETCDAVAGCRNGAALACDDGVACTVDACNELTDSCDNKPSDAACDDGHFCNGAETCDARADCQGGTAPHCDDGIACTTDSCDDTARGCLHVPDDRACDDGLFCNGMETCDPDADCQAGTAPGCDDRVGCTTDSCDEDANACVHTPDDDACDDARFCNGRETCDRALDCQSGAAPSCDDRVRCTTDTCDAASDGCLNIPNDSACDDGRFCNGAEVCDPDLDCRRSTTPRCEDGVTCTIDACDEATDSCAHLPDDSACDDGLFCNGAERCDLLNGCVDARAPRCDDGVACTVDDCNEATDSCTHGPDDSVCAGR